MDTGSVPSRPSVRRTSEIDAGSVPSSAHSSHTPSIRPASSASATSVAQEPPACILVRDGDRIERRTFDSAAALQTELEGTRSDLPRPVFILHGLPADYVNALRDSLNIDPDFIETHAKRHRYRPRKCKRASASWGVRFEYPEPGRRVPGFRTPSARGANGIKYSRYLDAMDEPIMEEIDHPFYGSGKSVLFCRASLWVGEKADGASFTSPLSNA